MLAWGGGLDDPALPNHLVEADARGNGDIQALDLAEHGDLYEVVAEVTRLFAQTPALAPEDKSKRTGEVGLVEALGAAIRGADKANTHFLELANGAGQVAHLEKRHDVGPAAGDGPCGLGQPAGALTRRNHCGHARTGSGAQTGSEVVRVLHAVENKDEGLRSGGLDSIKELILIFDQNHLGKVTVTRSFFKTVNGVATHGKNDEVRKF